MCFVVRKEKFEVKVAEKDIKCFKIMDKIDNYTFYSMYQRFTYKKNQNYKEKSGFSKAVEDLEEAYRLGFQNKYGEFYLYSKHFHDLEYLSSLGINEEFYRFGKGGFHSFSDLEERDVFGTGFVGVECIIPKGSRYVEGIDATENKKAYFSDEITIVGEVNFNKN